MGVTFDLTLRPTPTAAAAAAAWFIPGDDVAGWVDELCRWGVPLGDVRLYVVPTSGRDRRPCGVLAVTPNRPRADRALPYAAVGRLFFPAEAAIDPPVSADDLAVLRHEVQVLHPAAGLVGFDAADGVAVADLIAPPPRRAADWSAADAGPPPLPPLRSVEAEPVPTADLLAAGADDIGASADQELAPDPPATLGGKIKRLFSRGNPSTDLAEKRRRELEKLVELIKSDPDAGLRHALPLREMAGRGVAPPSASLGTRRVDFSLAGLGGGGGPRDSWSVDHDLRRRLTAEYREAATRELDLGRHRRAAYIFAHLLGDFAAAAAALAKGRYFREAAAVYTEHLRNPRAAADCLAGGGLLAEAIPLYRELSLYETAGDLHGRLGHGHEAASCYRDAVAQHLARHDPVGAAKLLAGKLDEPDQGLAVLANAWPDSDKAALCLHEWFAMAERHGRHEAAARRAGELRDATVPWYRAAALAETLSAVAVRYSAGPVRDRAADAVRAVAGRRLAEADAAERAALVRAVVGLVPGDRLLGRDGERFTRPPAAAAKPAMRLKEEPPLVRSFRLPDGWRWQSVVGIDGGGFLALGADAGSLVLTRGQWDGRTQTQVLKADRDAATGGGLLLPPDPRGRASVLLERPVPFHVELAATDGFPTRMSITALAGNNANTVAACRHENGTALVLDWGMAAEEPFAHTELSLAFYDVDGSPLLTRTVGELDVDRAAAFPMPMAARRDEVYIGGDGVLLHLTAGTTREIDLGGSAVRSITPNLPHTAVRMAVGLDEGWALVRGDDVQRFGSQLVRPVVTFTPDGSIVAVGQGLAHEYRATSTGPAFARAFEVACREPVAVLPAGGGQVGCVDADGSVSVYRYAGR